MIRLIGLREDKTVALAMKELTYYLDAMGYCGAAELKLGCFEDLALFPSVEDPSRQDEYAVEFQGGKGYVVGSNPRSVLFGAYCFLEQCGARWVRPGKDGSYLPKISALPEDISLRKVAQRPCRGICIEGAITLEHALNMIEWMPKVGMNTYYTQFRDGFVFFDRWFSHQRNTVKQAEPFTIEQAEEFYEAIHAAVRERGLILYGMGHGWTCDAFGLYDHGWTEVEDKDIPQSYRQICAQVEGERRIQNHIPMATHLCYSRPEVRSAMVEYAVDFLKKRPYMDVLGYTLADYLKNTCECETCRAHRLSDYYVMILNELDKRLTEEGIDIKIGVTLYHDTLYGPVEERLQNPNRFILMFCPISRSRMIGEVFTSRFPDCEPSPYLVNKWQRPVSAEENLARLKTWKRTFEGSFVIFDYHLMWDHLFDAGGEGIARMLHEDIGNYAPLGLEGLISCQSQRNAFPTSLAMTVMSKSLFDGKTSFDGVRKELYASAFGEESAEAVGEYLATLSRCFDVGAIRFLEPDDALGSLLEEGIAVMQAFLPEIESHLNVPDPCHAKSWRILEAHNRIYRMVAQCLLALLNEKNEDADALRDRIMDTVWREEALLSDVMDCYIFDDVIRKRPRLPQKDHTLF